MKKTISRVGLSTVLVLILALVCLPVTSLGATEQSFTGKVIGIECTAVGIIVSISVTAREGITEQRSFSTAQAFD